MFSKVVEVAVADLRLCDSPLRAGGENAGHVRLLAEANGLPPIVVDRATMGVIDGVHRWRAAQARGQERLPAVFFEGDPAEAFVLAVRLNTAHGLPLSLADRKAAVERILRTHPQWSDRAIAGVSGVSDKTVAAARRRLSADSPQPTGRVARNGVWHRTDRVRGRARAVELWAADPGASVRAIAAKAGISVTTAKDIRQRLRKGQDPLRLRPRPLAEPADTSISRLAPAPAAATAAKAESVEELRRLRKDPSLRFTDSGRTLLRWLDAPAGDDTDWTTLIANIPSHAVASVAKLARQRAHDWQHLARLLEQRAHQELESQNAS
ncbi:helix-turn-helix domain-containing protein [Nocardia sp. CDC159]|uniref:Helix-turn-helix domain-containing protein n=1 Tax=Nocardia pulmonis TaxID=2951408 RepID=A0A9X2IWV4_9NOCA|nr:MULTISPECIES: helix-turn-helix domain-containing protein [Nocardia]MCM6773170.1 helix-turn-helix domain-containing protein [Nocardia pulmonis]MCM6785527.1 helix-turn-helix domain-containing protein [Nocardia sp. CDC159]